jgi:hypothetical protein
MPIHTHVERRDIDPRLDEALRCAIAIGALLVLLLPAARGAHATLGWLPLWLIAMPLTAWWALHRFRLPMRRPEWREPAPAHRTVRRIPQARRRARTAAAPRLPHAA